MKVVKHGSAFLGTCTCEACECEFEYSEKDLHSYYDHENDCRVVCVTCPECGEKVTVKVVDYGASDH